MITDVNDAMLMAFADGELDAETEDAVARAVAGDPVLAQRLAIFAGSREAAHTAYADILHAPVPEQLVQAIRRRSAGKSPSGRQGGRSAVGRPGPFSQPSRRLAWPVAACLCLALGFAGGRALDGPAFDAGNVLSVSPAIADILASQPSGPDAARLVEGAGTVTLLGTFSTERGPCRLFSLVEGRTALRGIGCDRGGGYSVDLLVADDAAADGFAPASNEAAASLDTYLSSLEAEGPLNLAAEAELLSAARQGP